MFSGDGTPTQDELLNLGVSGEVPSGPGANLGADGARGVREEVSPIQVKPHVGPQSIPIANPTAGGSGIIQGTPEQLLGTAQAYAERSSGQMCGTAGEGSAPIRITADQLLKWVQENAARQNVAAPSHVPAIPNVVIKAPESSVQSEGLAKMFAYNLRMRQLAQACLDGK